MKPGPCAKCGKPHNRKQRTRDGYRRAGYCYGCHAAYNAQWRQARTVEFHRLRRAVRLSPRETLQHRVDVK